MNLTVKINGKQYVDKMVQGASFSDEYNETLDSGAVVLDHIPRMKELRQFDDVYIWDSSKEFNGFKKYRDEILLPINYAKNNHLAQRLYIDPDVPPIILPDEQYPIPLFAPEVRINAELYNLIISADLVVSCEEMPMFYSYLMNDVFEYENDAIDPDDDAIIGIKPQMTYHTSKYEFRRVVVHGTPKVLFCPENQSELFTGDESTVINGLPYFVISREDLPTITFYRGSIHNEKKPGDLFVFSDKEITTVFVDEYESVFDLSAADYYKENFKQSETFKDSIGEPDGFYKHLLVDRAVDSQVMLQSGIEDETILYKYQIELFSETTGLEKVQLPNISITQPLNMKYKRTTYDYICQIVKQYSPTYKLQCGEQWFYARKYTVSETLRDIFDKSYCPDFSLNNPNLRDVLAQLMITKDMIPYVKDDVIYALDITARTGAFDSSPESGVNFISGTISSDNCCDGLRRVYSNALSQDNTCHIIEYLGFRNAENALMTLGNMRLEFRNPIYKINRFYMCYYKKAKYKETIGGESQDIVFLCKQDITDLIKLDSERNLLSQDWSDFSPSSAADLGRYKLSTIGYSQGATFISGWGDKYSVPVESILTTYDFTKTYIENIFRFMDSFYPFGVSTTDYIISNYLGKSGGYLYVSRPMLPDTTPFANIVSPFADADTAVLSAKGLFFEVDYDGFFNGALIHSRDNGRDNIIINDNSSSSLTLLEKDGLNQKEKVNRFSNKNYLIKARYDDISKVQQLGSVANLHEDDDVIIYKREYQIYDNFVLCSYAGVQDYVLKNYFTSVYARHRTYRLMSYGESISKPENRKMFVIMSKEKEYYENPLLISFNSFDGSYLSSVVSCFKDSPQISDRENPNLPDNINYGYLTYNGNKYATDINAFSSGYSLGFNLSMGDNISGGTYITQTRTEYAPLASDLMISDLVDVVFNAGNVDQYKNDFIGSKQDWYRMANTETGFAKRFGFYVFHSEQKNNYKSAIGSNITPTVNTVYNELLSLPKLASNSVIFDTPKNIIGGEYILNKDNKERIDMTFQIEPISVDKNIVFSEWLMKLSDLIGSHYKYDNPFDINISAYRTFDTNGLFEIQTYLTTLQKTRSAPRFTLALDQNEIDRMFVNDLEIRFEIVSGWGYAETGTDPLDYIYRIRFWAEKVEYADPQKRFIIFKGSRTARIYSDGAYIDVFEPDKTLVLFKRTDLVSTKTIYDNTIVTTLDVFAANFSYITSDTNLTGKYFYKEETIRPSGALGVFYDVMIIGFEPSITNYSDRKYFGIPATSETMIPVLYQWSPYDQSYTVQQNKFLVLSSSPLKKTIIYDEYREGEFPKAGDIISDQKISEIITVDTNEFGSTYIFVDLAGIDLTNVESVQYWYFNDSLSYVKKHISDIVNYDDDTSGTYDAYTYNYEPQNSSYRFVFGVNLTEQDKQNGFVKIYLSAISNRDTRVYDENHNVIGSIKNFANTADIRDKQLTDESDDENEITQ